MIPPTVTVAIRDAVRHAQERAARLERTQQLEIGEDLFIRVAPGGRKFLLFKLEGEPEQSQAQAIAEVLGLREPQFGWHQGATLRSLTVAERDEESSKNSDDTESHHSNRS